MLGWPHSGFGAYLGPRIEDRAGVLRVARYSARAPVAESRLGYDADRAEVELISDRRDGPYAGVHRMAALEFIARWVDHVPERYEVRGAAAGGAGGGLAGAAGTQAAGGGAAAAGVPVGGGGMPALWRRDAHPRVRDHAGDGAAHPRAP
ncbi:MAG TPA: transposase [Candidatus Eisenbacteria bacterium]